MLARKCSRLAVSAWVGVTVLAVALVQSAFGMHVLRGEIGDGDSSFKIAIINDIHYGDPNSPGDLRKAIDTINYFASTETVLFTMIDGDLANTGDTSAGGFRGHNT